MTSPVSGTGSGEAARAPIAVFLLDDHEIVRRGVRDLLEAEADITVIGEAGTASSALARIPALKPDVAGSSIPGGRSPRWNWSTSPSTTMTS